MRSGFAILLPLLLAAAPPGESEAPALLEGVRSIAAPGVPGPLCVLSEDAFPLVAGGPSGEPVAAAGRFGKGRVVALGHNGFLGAEALAAGDTRRLLDNAVRWAAGPEAKAPRVASLGRTGLGLRGLSGSAWAKDLEGVDVLVADVHGIGDRERPAVQAFLRRGGGLVAGGLGWGWLQLHPGKSIQDHPGNILLAEAGILWADGTLERTAPAGFAAGGDLRLSHARRALDLLAAQAAGRAKPEAKDLRRASAVLTRAALTAGPGDAHLLPDLVRLRTKGGAALPSPAKPLTLDAALARVLLALDVRELEALPPEKTRAHPAAAAFPGSIPDGAPRVKRVVEIDLAVPRWHSTGLYAAPGEVLEVRLAEAASRLGLALRIGVHTDELWGLDAWPRVPAVSLRRPLDGTRTAAASAFGGLVFVEVPAGLGPGRVPVEIAGAVEAPLFVRGRTDPAAWRREIRDRPAPWAELASSKVILAVPSETARRVEDPEALMAFWDRVMDACADLAAVPRDRPSPERYAADTEISVGYMHSGYPIMTHLDAAPHMTDLAALSRGEHGWGLFHEMGHDHQAPEWTFDGAVEVTCNLFTLYVMETVCGRPPGAGHEGFPLPAERIRAYRATGPDFGRWKADPFLALAMYNQMRQEFGWEAFRRVFAEYRGLPERERPAGDAAKRDQWLARFSRAVGRDLGPFFEAWGVPVSPAARAAAAAAGPPWMPEGFPPDR